jgi:hypothetical protein
MQQHTKWEAEFKDDEMEASSLTTGSSRGNHMFLFTGHSKGARKHEGWNAEGMRHHNQVFDLVSLQHGCAGCTFERDLSKKTAGAKKGGRSKEDENQAPRARNNLDLLRQMVGV